MNTHSWKAFGFRPVGTIRLCEHFARLIVRTPARTLTLSARSLLLDRHRRQIVGKRHLVVVDFKLGRRLTVEGCRLTLDIHVITPHDIPMITIESILYAIVGASDEDTIHDSQRLAVEVVVRLIGQVVSRSDVVPEVRLDDRDDLHDRLGDDLDDDSGLVQNVLPATVGHLAVREADLVAVDVQCRLGDGTVVATRTDPQSAVQHGVEHRTVAADKQVVSTRGRRSDRVSDRANGSVRVGGDVDARYRHDWVPSRKVELAERCRCTQSNFLLTGRTNIDIFIMICQFIQLHK